MNKNIHSKVLRVMDWRKFCYSYKHNVNENERKCYCAEHMKTLWKKKDKKLHGWNGPFVSEFLSSGETKMFYATSNVWYRKAQWLSWSQKWPYISNTIEEASHFFPRSYYFRALEFQNLENITNYSRSKICTHICTFQS